MQLRRQHPQTIPTGGYADGTDRGRTAATTLACLIPHRPQHLAPTSHFSRNSLHSLGASPETPSPGGTTHTTEGQGRLQFDESNVIVLGLGVVIWVRDHFLCSVSASVEHLRLRQDARVHRPVAGAVQRPVGQTRSGGPFWGVGGPKSSGEAGPCASTQQKGGDWLPHHLLPRAWLFLTPLKTPHSCRLPPSLREAPHFCSEFSPPFLEV